MNTYLVGGAVRDLILGRATSDYDYVVVGSSPEDMLDQGFVQVGSNFPVFLHPITKDEYALARTEKNTGVKYQDFDCYFGKDVTIEEDLYRRDLTINSIAWDTEGQEYIDPYKGLQDLKDKVLRHTSEAFTEDPVRVLRLARFKSQLGGGWSVALPI
jgi:tRNA nucleotidyltransferase (CCA-adding enzyme)